MKETHSPGTVCKNWWVACIAADRGAARQARAELRRAESVTDALAVSATHDLNRRLADAEYDLRKRRDGPDRLALIAVALAQLTEDLGATAAQRFGSGDPKALSGLRFNALIRAREPRELMRPLARALRIIKGGANVRKLAADLYWWTDTTRTNWCFDFHGARDAKPNPEETKA